MTSFVVVIAPSAERDIAESFLWGCEYWGVEMAIDWANELRTTIEEKLPAMPRSFPVAHENDGSGREFRQLLTGRYRVIFHIQDKTIFVVHVRGPFSGSADKTLGVDE
jgi:plasmid stabilization system protein ParE